MALTENQARVLAHAYALRLDELPGKSLWFCAEDRVLPECYCLLDRGYLQRRWHGADMVLRLTDEAMTAQHLSGLLGSVESRQN